MLHWDYVSYVITINLEPSVIYKMTDQLITIYVGNLPQETNETQLYEFFNKYGNVKEVRMRRFYAFVVSI